MMVNTPPIYYPRPVTHPGFANRSVTLDATTTQLAFPIQITESGNIDSIAVLLGTITQTGTLTLELQRPVTSTGFPNDTAITNGTATVTSPTQDAWNTFDFSTNPAVTNGETLYVVISRDGTTDIDIANNTTGYNNQWVTGKLVTYAGSWAAGDLTAAPRFRILYDDGRYPFQPNRPAFDLDPASVNMGPAQSVKEAGVRFRIPFTARLAGMFGIIDYQSNDLMGKFWLYEDSEDPPAGTELHRPGGLDYYLYAPANNGFNHYWFKTPKVVSRDTWYRFTYEPLATSNRIYRAENFSAALAEQAGYKDWQYTETTDSTSWTTTGDATRILTWSLAFDQIDIGQPLILNNNPLLRM